MKIALTVGPYIPLVGPAADDYDVAAKLRCGVCVCGCLCVGVFARARSCLRQLASVCMHVPPQHLPFTPLLHRVLPCVSESPVRINGLVLKHLNGRASSIIVEITKHYKRQVTQRRVTCDV